MERLVGEPDSLRDFLDGAPQGASQSVAAFRSSRVANVPEVPDVERHVSISLRDEHHRLPNGMSDANLVEHIRISTAAVGDHDTGVEEPVAPR